MEKRLKYIDIARGLAIIFIVFGHTIVHSSHCSMIYKFISAFQVPLFFILSGYTFKIKEDISFTAFIKKKFVRIMIPYLVWAVLFLIPFMILGSNVNSVIKTSTNFDLGNCLINILYGNGNNGALRQNTSLWFLPALFTMEIVYFFIVKYLIQKLNLKKSVFCFLLLLSYVSNYFITFRFPLGINTFLNIGIFFYVGYLIKDTKDSFCNFPSIILLILIGTIACFLNPKTINYPDYDYGYITLALISGVSISIAIIFSSIILKNSSLIEYIGKNTMGILIFHKIIILVFQTKLGIISNFLRNSNVVIEIIISIFILITTVVFSLAITEFIKKYFPLLIGENKEMFFEAKKSNAE